MVENTKNATENQQEVNKAEEQKESATKTENQQENKPTVEELLARIAEKEAENQKLQNKNNALSSENAKQKQAIRANQTAEQREADERAEALRLANEEKEAAQKELNHMKAIAAYKSISDENTVENLIEAISESDHASVAAIIENEKAKAVKAAKAEWEKTTPPPQHGTGEYSSMTISEAMKIPDREAKLKAIARTRNQR